VPTPKGLEQERLGLILDIPLKVTVLLGRTRWPIKDILELTPGSVVELQNLVDEPVEVLVNGTLVAMGEVVVVNENFGVRLTNIIKPEERLQKLAK
jgi:flagellar motor switch protein FliN/FliY